MRARMICGTLVVGVSLLAMSVPASANLFTDQYIGGLDTYNGLPVSSAWDVIGNSDFQVYGMDVTLSGTTLQATVYTNFVNHIGEDNVGLGALFIGTGPVNYNITGLPLYTNTGPSVQPGDPYDTYAADTGRFQYAAQLDKSVYDPANKVSNPAQGLYNVASNGSNVELANVNGNTNTAGFPVNGNSGYYFRSGQAVGVTGGTTVAGTNVSYQIQNSVSNPFAAGNTGALIFTISNVLGAGQFLAISAH